MSEGGREGGRRDGGKAGRMFDLMHIRTEEEEEETKVVCHDRGKNKTEKLF